MKLEWPASSARDGQAGKFQISGRSSRSPLRSTRHQTELRDFFAGCTKSFNVEFYRVVHFTFHFGTRRCRSYATGTSGEVR